MRLETIPAANAELFSCLSVEESRTAQDAVNAFTRSLLRLPYTGMPTRGYIRIMPPIHVPPDDVIPDWETGTLLYEYEEDRLWFLDMQQHIARRQMAQHTWTYYSSRMRRWRRCLDTTSPTQPPPHTYAELVVRAHRVLTEITELIGEIHGVKK